MRSRSMAAWTSSTVLGSSSPFLSSSRAVDHRLAQALALGPERVDPQRQRPLFVHRHLVDADGHAFGGDSKGDLLDQLGLDRRLDRPQ